MLSFARTASISPEEELVDLKDDYVTCPGGDDGKIIGAALDWVHL